MLNPYTAAVAAIGTQQGASALGRSYANSTIPQSAMGGFGGALRRRGKELALPAGIVTSGALAGIGAAKAAGSGGGSGGGSDRGMNTQTLPNPQGVSSSTGALPQQQQFTGSSATGSDLMDQSFRPMTDRDMMTQAFDPSGMIFQGMEQRAQNEFGRHTQLQRLQHGQGMEFAGMNRQQEMAQSLLAAALDDTANYRSYLASMAGGIGYR